MKAGIAGATGAYVLVSMADGSDEPHVVDPMVELARGGADVVAASRYMQGGHQVGGPPLKRLMSRTAGLTLHWFAGVADARPDEQLQALLAPLPGRRDDREHGRLRAGARAHRQGDLAGRRVAEVPTTWRDRTAGQSNFKLRKWLPHYLHWYWWPCAVGSLHEARRGVRTTPEPPGGPPRRRASPIAPTWTGCVRSPSGSVMLAHLQWPIRKDSADIGVTAFFVLSGYLITSILVRERERTGRIRLGRVLPARGSPGSDPPCSRVLAFALVFGSGGRLPAGWQLGIVSTLLYFSNWVQAAGIAIHPLGHTWSLAIEEQFYLLWPLVLILAWRRAFWIALALIPIAFAVRVIATGYPEYFSTFTRVDAILLGCVLAFVQPRWPTWVAVVGVVALILTSVAFETDQHDLAVPAAMSRPHSSSAGAFLPSGVWPRSASGPTASTCGTRR